MAEGYKIILFSLILFAAWAMDGFLSSLSPAPTFILPIITLFFIIRSEGSLNFLVPTAIIFLLSDIASSFIFGASALAMVLILLVIRRAYEALNLGSKSLIGSFISVLFFLTVFIILTVGSSYLIRGDLFNIEYLTSLSSSFINILPVIVTQVFIIVVGCHIITLPSVKSQKLYA